MSAHLPLCCWLEPSDKTWNWFFWKKKKIKWKKSKCDEPKNWKRVDVVDESINSSDSGAPQVDAGCSLIKKHTWHSAQRGRQSFRENFSGEKYYNSAPAAGFIDYWIFSSISEGDAYSFWATGHSSFHPKFFKNLATVPFLLKTLKGFHFFFNPIQIGGPPQTLSKGRRFIDFFFSFFFLAAITSISIIIVSISSTLSRDWDHSACFFFIIIIFLSFLARWDFLRPWLAQIHHQVRDPCEQQEMSLSSADGSLYFFGRVVSLLLLLLAAVDDCDYLVWLLLLLFVDPHLVKTPLFTLVVPMFHLELDGANDETDFFRWCVIFPFEK